MNKRTFLLVGIVVAVAGIFWFTSNQNAEAPSEQPTSNLLESQTVTYYEDRGFVPSEITVKQGETVTFQVPSNAEIPVWVASDPHPEHTNYPEFDAARILDALPNPGEGYSFTFDQVGEWEFHNHTFPDHTGVINVIE